jgi:replicative superfamily II helicase
LLNRRKAVILVPLKALAEQKYRQIQQTFGRLGAKCLVVTGDYPDNYSRFAAGRYDISVAVYEKFDLLLTESLDVLGTIGLVAIDELQNVFEPGRGAVLERLITKLFNSVYQPSIVGLSAVIGDTTESAGILADWFNAVLVRKTPDQWTCCAALPLTANSVICLSIPAIKGANPLLRLIRRETRSTASSIK